MFNKIIINDWYENPRNVTHQLDKIKILNIIIYCATKTFYSHV